ncbi:phosphohydrolase [Geodermatophilus sp. SYSU D00742]
MPDPLAGADPAAARGAADPLDAHPLVAGARHLAGDLLGDLGDRWRHTQAVAHRATTAAPAVDPGDRPVLIAAAWLHDIGYATPLRRSGFHPLDGAWHLADHHWPALLTGLVAHHSGARFVAAVLGLGPYLQRFDDGRFTSGPLADALVYADQTTSPAGEAVDVDERLEDMLHRHGADSPNARAHDQRAPVIRAAVERTRTRLQLLAGTGAGATRGDRRGARMRAATHRR